MRSSESTTPRVGIIVPLYNKEEYVRRALESIRIQSFQDYEVVVVDDGSTDSGPDIVRQVSDPRVLLLQQRNTGAGPARNRGAAERPFEILAFLDADDEWLPGHLERCVQILDSHPKCDFVIRGYLKGSTRKPASEVLTLFGDYQGRWNLPTASSGFDVHCAINACFTSSTVCRKNTFDRYGGFFSGERHNWGEDAYLWLQVLFNHTAYVDTSPSAWYNTEASWRYRDAKLPPHAVLIDTGPLWNNCPPKYTGALRRYLSYLAKSTVGRLAAQGHVDEAVRFVLANPWGAAALEKLLLLMKCYSPKNLLRLHMPGVFDRLKRIRHRFAR